ncbi:MAG: hypothetical protein H8D43_04150 [Chloroflexi bacterium]|nr:hypothetical protein [Chloroflexota bacterium]
MTVGARETGLTRRGGGGTGIHGDVNASIDVRLSFCYQLPELLKLPKKNLRRWLVAAITAVLTSFILAVIAEGPGTDVYQMLKELIGWWLGFR